MAVKNKNYNIFMIGMKDHPISVMYQRECLPSWKDYKVKIFDAVTPKDLYLRNQLTFTKHYKGREFTSTEKAIWYSNFDLWCKCVLEEKPMLIIEHDSKLVKPLPDLSKEKHKFVSFIDRDFGHKGIDLAPGSGYYITPTWAEKLIAKAVCRPIDHNSDGHIGHWLKVYRQKARNDYQYVEQINIDGLNTIDHKSTKNNRKFIGPDYENFDLSSIHRKAV